MLEAMVSCSESGKYAPTPNYSPHRCHVRVIDIAAPIALVNPNYDGILPRQVKGKLLRISDGGLRKVRSEPPST
jgi:hypothetical protein